MKENNYPTRTKKPEDIDEILASYPQPEEIDEIDREIYLDGTNGGGE